MTLRGRLVAAASIILVVATAVVSEWLRPSGARATLAWESRANGAPVPEARRIAIYRAFACGRGNTNDCADTR